MKKWVSIAIPLTATILIFALGLMTVQGFYQFKVTDVPDVVIQGKFHYADHPVWFTIGSWIALIGFCVLCFLGLHGFISYCVDDC